MLVSFEGLIANEFPNLETRGLFRTELASLGDREFVDADGRTRGELSGFICAGGVGLPTALRMSVFDFSGAR